MVLTKHQGETTLDGSGDTVVAHLSSVRVALCNIRTFVHFHQQAMQQSWQRGWMRPFQTGYTLHPWCGDERELLQRETLWMCTYNSFTPFVSLCLPLVLSRKHYHCCHSQQHLKTNAYCAWFKKLMYFVSCLLFCSTPCVIWSSICR